MLLETENNELPDLIRNGEKKGYEILYKKYAAALYGLIFRLVKDEALAEELLQETFLRIVKNMNSDDENKLSFFTRASQTAREICRDALKNKISANGTAGPSDPDDCPEVLKLIFWNGHSAEETARIMNISVDEVKVCLREAFKTIKPSVS